MKTELTHQEVKELFRRYRQEGLEPPEDLALRVGVPAYPELAAQLEEWDRLEEEALLVHTAPAPVSTGLRSRIFSAWDATDETRANSKDFPIFNPGSTTEELMPWIPDEVLHPTKEYDNILVQTLSQTEEATTLLIHLKDALPAETHFRTIEQFVIVQGHCIVEVAGEETTLEPGDYFRIPLTKPHSVTVTSKEPCVFICQRIPAA